MLKHDVLPRPSLLKFPTSALQRQYDSLLQVSRACGILANPASFSLKRGFGSTLPRCGRVGHGETRSCSRAKPQRRVYHHDLTPDKGPATSFGALLLLLYSQEKRRADEQTRTASCSLRVIHQTLQGLAQHCKTRISNEVSFLCYALGCIVLRSRWCQSDVRCRRLRVPTSVLARTVGSPPTLGHLVCRSHTAGLGSQV